MRGELALCCVMFASSIVAGVDRPICIEIAHSHTIVYMSQPGSLACLQTTRRTPRCRAGRVPTAPQNLVKIAVVRLKRADKKKTTPERLQGHSGCLRSTEIPPRERFPTEETAFQRFGLVGGARMQFRNVGSQHWRGVPPTFPTHLAFCL